MLSSKWNANFSIYDFISVMVNIYFHIIYSMSLITQHNEPFFVANIQNYFADFPYPLYSINKRLLTSET